ncbi:MAG TPA: glycosyltransferase [Opitutaceae bacterium]|nr:glycosyltransferase [Opitutaceae bacterium]
MNASSEVSVVIPAYNAARFLRETLESVIAQQNVETEIVVVDDGSVDDTLDIARSFNGRVRVVEGAHKGAQAARNVGLALSTAPFVKFLDADDVLLPGSLSRQLAAAKTLDVRSIPYGPARTMDESGQIGNVLAHTPPDAGLHPVAHMLFYSPLTSCPLHRRTLLNEVGGMDETLPREHENDLHIRLCLAGVRFAYDAEPVYAYRRHANHNGLMAGGMTRFGTTWMLDYLRLQEMRIASHFEGRVPSDVLLHLAWFYWKSGRAVLREGHESDAWKFFEEARRVFPANPVCGRGVYRMLSSFAGPVRAERWLNRARARQKGVGSSA